MTTYLTEDWVAALIPLAAHLPERPGLDLTMNYEIAASPQGKVRYHEVWQSGQLVAAAIGKSKEATCEVRFKYSDALPVMQGDVDPDVSYMQGRFKIDGDYHTWIYGFRPLLDSDEYLDYRNAVTAATTFE